MPERRGTSGRSFAGAGGSANPGLAKSLDIATPYREAASRLVKYFTYWLPDNDKVSKPSPPHPDDNKERLTEWMSGLRPNLFRWSPQYQRWVETYGPLALTVVPVTGDYKEQAVREQEVKLAVPETELPPEILSQLLGLPQEAIEGKTLKQLLPAIPKPADLDLLKRNSIPTLDPYVVALGTSLEHRVPYLYVLAVGEKEKHLEAPAMEYTFKGLGTGAVDPADIELVLNRVVPGRELILRLTDKSHADSEGFISLLGEFGVENPEDLVDESAKLRELYHEGWRLKYRD